MTFFIEKKIICLSLETALLDRVELNTPVPRKSKGVYPLLDEVYVSIVDAEPQRRSSVDNQSERTTFSAKLRDLSPSKQRFQSVPKPSDLKRAIKFSPIKGGLDIDMTYLLKFPIEVWVSSGEPFVNPTRSLILDLLSIVLMMLEI